MWNLIFFPQKHFVENVENLCYPNSNKKKSVDNVVDTSVSNLFLL